MQQYLDWIRKNRKTQGKSDRTGKIPDNMKNSREFERIRKNPREYKKAEGNLKKPEEFERIRIQNILRESVRIWNNHKKNLNESERI